MNQGDIIEQGTHQELLEAKGFYADMYNAQFDDTQSTAAVKK
jgi:ATP-binding cassette subfamily B protein